MRQALGIVEQRIPSAEVAHPLLNPERRIRAAFVYANSRSALALAVDRRGAPDTGLLGQNHLRPLGIDAVIHDPPRVFDSISRPLHRIAWHLREASVPWQVGDADVLCTALAGLVPLAARIRRRPRTVLLNMGLCRQLERHERSRRLLRASLASAQRIVCFAESQRGQLLALTRLEPERVRTVLFGVDDVFYRPTALPRDGYVLAVGRDLARDYATFCKAITGLRTKAIIVASARNVRGIALPPNARTLLDVPYPRLRELYHGAACVVVPTRGEDYPYGADCSGHTVLLEAMACGRPTVITARSTNREYVEDGVSAISVPPDDAEALRESITRVLCNHQLARELGMAARRRIDEEFTTRAMAERLAPVLLEAAAG